MRDEQTQPDAAAANDDQASYDFDFAPAEDLMAQPDRRRAPRDLPRPSARSTPEDVGTLDAALAQEADALLDLPLPFESVDETLATPPSPPPAEDEASSDAPADATAVNEHAGQEEPTARPKEPASQAAQPVADKSAADDAPPAATPPAPDRLSDSAVGPLVRLLMALNFPLRFVPQALRPAVDIIALTLLFWAPVVWGLALFVFNQPQ